MILVHIITRVGSKWTACVEAASNKSGTNHWTFLGLPIFLEHVYDLDVPRALRKFFGTFVQGHGQAVEQLRWASSLEGRHGQQVNNMFFPGRRVHASVGSPEEHLAARPWSAVAVVGIWFAPYNAFDPNKGGLVFRFFFC